MRRKLDKFKSKIKISLYISIISILLVGIAFGSLGFTFNSSPVLSTHSYQILDLNNRDKDANFKSDINPNEIVSSKIGLSHHGLKLDITKIIASASTPIFNTLNEHSKSINSVENNSKTNQSFEQNINREKVENTAEAQPQVEGNLGNSTAQTQAETQAENQNQQTQTVNLNDVELQILSLINTVRVQNGLNPLVPNQMLTDIARTRSMDMQNRNYFSHYTPEGKNIFNILKESGVIYVNAGENLGQASPISWGTPEVFMNAWMNSPTHKANILRSAYGKIGIGVIDSGNRRVVTTIFMN